MIEFTRQPSGLYLITGVSPADARVAFLFQQDPSKPPATFKLTANSWIDPNQLGYIAFFQPAATLPNKRDWNAFAAAVRAAFAANSGAQIGWFTEPLGPDNQPLFMYVSNQGSANPPPQLQQTFTLTLRNVTFAVQVNVFDPSTTTTVLFDDATNSIQLKKAPTATTVFTLSATPPGGVPVTYQTPAPFATLPMLGPLTGTVTITFPLTTDNLTQFEAGMMFFSPAVDGGLLGALNYPVFRGAGGSTAAFNFTLWLDGLDVLLSAADPDRAIDPNRTFLQFTDATVGSNYVTANGRSLAFNTVNGSDVSKWSRLVFAGRPVQSLDPTQQDYYYLTPAGQFGLALDGVGAAAAAPAADAPDTAEMLCGVTGTEYLTIKLGTTPDSLLFTSGMPAYRVPPDQDSPTQPQYLSAVGVVATTSYAQIVMAPRPQQIAGADAAYVSQPERAPLYGPGSTAAAVLEGPAPASGLKVHILDYLPLDSWTGKQPAPSTPLAPYAGLAFATNPNLDVNQFREMESRALNPKRAQGYLSAPAPKGAARRTRTKAAAAVTPNAMTPQGMLAAVSGQAWTALQMAISNAGILQITNMGSAITKAVQQNQIFTVVSTDPSELFDFSADKLAIGDWTFSLSPGGLAAPDGTPPIFIMKFYPQQTIENLVNDTRLWSDPNTFNTKFTAQQTQAYLQQVIADAKASVFPGGQKEPDKNSLYYNFWTVVTNPAFNGILVVNCNMQLDALPSAIRAVLGGMKDPGIAGFRVHHVGVEINNTDPAQGDLKLARSSTFALVDYEKTKPAAPNAGVGFDYNFEVEYLRALFTNSELRSFACQINLTINSLFDTGVNKEQDQAVALADGAGANTISIMGSYQAHSTSGDDSSSGQGVYSFVAQGNFVYNFTDSAGKSNNKYLKKITLTKLQFSFDQETKDANNPDTSRISSHFGIWGSLEFNELNVLDIFSFQKLQFSDLGIDVGFDLTIIAGQQPTTKNLALAFAPGNLRLDLGNTTTKKSATSLLNLIPFKLKSFLYSQKADQTVESLNYYSLPKDGLAGLAANGISLVDNFNYALLFDLDLGSMGGLVGSLSAFKFSILIGWLSPANGGNLAFGIQLPQVDGKLEIKIQGVLTISIEQFTLLYATDATPSMLVLGLQNCFIEVFGTRIPPKGTVSIGLFAPTDGADQIGWIGAYNLGEDGGGGGGDKPKLLAAPAGGGAAAAADGGNGDGGVFELIYAGVGQRVGPDPKNPPTSFDDFLKFMQTTFWDDLKQKKYSEIYHPDGKWIIVTDFKLLKIIEVGLVFYDVTPFYALQLKLTGGAGKGFSFEITYTKVSDTIGLFAATFSLPDSLRTFQVGAASVTMPSLSVDVYTNGDWKVDLGFPDGDNWSVSFRVQAMAGPVPVTGSGGFYLESLSSATNPKIFKGTYQSIEGFGFAVRLGVGKDFTAGPLKAGVSLTFFGIIQGAAGYLTSGGTDLVKAPDALSLQGQFGIIGELYGSVDFVIIKASVNVRLQASVGIILALEPPSVPGGGNGSILLYIEASVSVSASVEINLFLFSVTISFSFNASFRFEWQLVGSSQSSAMLAARLRIADIRSQLLLTAAATPTLGLLPGLQANVPLLYLPELTVIFPDGNAVGTPWAVVSLGVQYDQAPPSKPSYADFKPFEAVTTQLATFALMHALRLPSYDAEVTLEFDPATGTPGLIDIDSEPDLLTGWLAYEDVLDQLANFKATIAVPTASTAACLFPMPPFVNIATKGRTVNGEAADFSYQFQTKNNVPQSYLKTVDDYFNQMFVNQTQRAPLPRMLAETLTPLTEEIFLDYFKGLIRGAVHQLLVTMQTAGMTKAKLTDLFCAAVGAPQPQTLFQQLAGQMSSALRGGVRLPYIDGLSVPPGGVLQTTTNPLFALLWQQFPVGGFAADNKYSITLSNPDGTQTWLAANASFDLTSALVAPYTTLKESDVVRPGSPMPIPLTSTGAQAFAFQSAIVWTPPAGAARSLRAFPANLARLQAAEASAVAMVFKSRAADGPYLPDGTALPAADVALATAINLTVKQIPGATAASPLADVFALSGASQSDEALLGLIISDLQGGDRPITSIQILYQTDATTPGLNSATVDPSQVFALRTNTTTVSQPPQALLALAAEAAPTVPVGATTQIVNTSGGDGGMGFLRIIQQATVTNAAGYYLRYIDSAGHSLPTALFVKGVAQVTMLISYAPGKGQNTPASPLSVQPYHNAVVLANTQASLVYYAETVDPALDIRYVKVAAGTFGVSLSRSEDVMKLAPTPALRASLNVSASAKISRGDAIKALRGAGVSDDGELQRALVAMQGAPAALNALYSLVSFQVQPSAGFKNGSNLSAPLQPQKPDDQATTGDYRVFAPLYNVATANIGAANPDRYASINQPFTLSFFTNDAFGNQLPTPTTYSDTNYYFDPILPLDQWMGVVPTYDFGSGSDKPAPNTIYIRLTPSITTFEGMSPDEREAALTNYQTILQQITGPGVSFYVETSLALQTGGGLVQFPVGTGDAAKVIDLVRGIVNWLAGGGAGFPGPVTITMAVSGPGTLPPLFEIVALFGIMRDPNLISPYLKDQFGTIIFPSAQNVATTLIPNTGGANAISAFAANFVIAFPAQKLAVGMNGTVAAPPAHLSSTALARRRLKSLKQAGDGSGGARAGAQSIWAAAATLLDISIGVGVGTGPRYLSPKPLDNALNSADVPLPPLNWLPTDAPPWPTHRLFVDIDLDQLNRTFFQTVDDVLGPASAAQAFEQAPDDYKRVALGREALAQKYSRYEVDWLFDPKSPFTGTPSQLTTAREVFEQQMRAALMTAYSVDTIVQYDVNWNKAVSAAADNYIELFGQVEAFLDGAYTVSGSTLTATLTYPHGLTVGSQAYLTFAAINGVAPPRGLYTVVGVGSDKSFSINVTSGSGDGTFAGTRQNAGLSTAHVAVNSKGASPLTFLYGNPDVTERAVVPFNLRYNVTNLQFFLAPPGPDDQARPSIWLQLIDPYPPQGIPHIGPSGTLTNIPVVLRQYPTPPTLVSQTWAAFTPPQPSGNPIADGSDWSYLYTYQAFLAAQDQVNNAITYNTDMSAAGGQPQLLAAAAGDGPYDLFTALTRSSAVTTEIQQYLQNLADANWLKAFQAFAACVDEVKNNTDWNPKLALAAAGLANVTDNYVVTDQLDGDLTTQRIELSWQASQGESSFANVMLSLTALDPASAGLLPYPQQTLTRQTDSIEVVVQNAPIGGLGVAHLIAANGLNVLAAENALAAIQVERNLIELDGFTVVSEFVYMTPLVRPSQPVTPLIDNPTPIDVAQLPNQGSGAACPPSPRSLCQRIYTLMANLLADPTQSQSLRRAHLAAGVTSGATRRVKVACSFSFPIPAVAGGAFSAASISPLVPIVLARSFDIDGQDPAQLGDFAQLFAAAIDLWAKDNAVMYGPNAMPPGAMLVFDITLYAALSGVDTPVLRFSNLQLDLTDIDPST